MSAPTWKDRLRDDLPEQIAGEVDHFEAQIELKKQGKLDDKLFAEARLRRGTYGQRYDNGLRDDGTGQKKLDYARPLTKGPDTLFDAPGMQRIKIPYGRITTAQLETIADLAEEYSDSILHVTTRQDIQLHFVHIEDTPSIMRRLGAVGITTREACGNSVRNVTACEFSGVCNDESFDVTPYADAAMHFFLGHPDVQDFGRKFKIAFSGCHDNPCGLVTFHDLGAIAKVRTINGEKKRGFYVVVGGGLGAVPVEAKVLDEFCPEEEILPLTQAVGRVFARLGEKQSRARARIKFLVDKLGIEEFKRLVLEERALLREDPRWTDFLKNLHGTDEKPLKAGAPLPTEGVPEGFAAFAKTNLIPQKQDGYFVAVVKMPLGDFTSVQARALADLSIKYTGNPMRLTVEQNLVFRWVSGADAVDLYRDLQAIELAEAGASTISDLVSCPGSDTCKLGISASRGLTSELRRRLTVIQDQLDPAVQKLHVKTSGCFNSCGQHHVADVGFLGVSRQVGGRKVPHFNVILGGQWTENAKSYGLVVGAVPSKNVPEALLGITQYYLDNREGEESFQDFIARLGKRGFRQVLKPYQAVPSYDVDPSYYRDWGDPREYGIGDIGVGECAGEIVPFAEFGLQQAEQQLFDAQDLLHEKRPAEASQKALKAMLTAAQALVRHTGAQLRDDAEDIVQGFRTHLHETQIFHDPFVKDKFAQFFFRIANEPRLATADETLAHRTLDEAALFIDASHACYQRMTEAASAASAAE